MLSYEFPPLGGGGSKVVDGLSAALAERGHHIDLVTTRFGDLQAFQSDGQISIWRISSWRSKLDRSNAFELATYALGAFLRTLALVRSRKYDVCHAHFIFPDGLIAWIVRLLTGQRFMITAHGSDVPGYNPDRFKIMHRILRPIWRRVVCAADCIVCPSESLESLLRSQHDTGVTAVIPNGFEPTRFAGDFAKSPFILCVTRLFRRKGVQHLIAAAQDIDPTFELHIVGDGPYREDLQQLAGDSKTTIRFHGWIDNDAPELEKLFGTASIFVLASEAENFPVSLLEAMSAGLAIVTIEGTGSADVVGEAGILVPPGDVQALRAALVRLIDDEALRSRLGTLARHRLADSFSWSRVAQLYLDLYHKYPAWPAGDTLPRTAAPTLPQEPLEQGPRRSARTAKSDVRLS
jgi:glycosyltransferase involved in cell wall biosynthesis